MAGAAIVMVGCGRMGGAILKGLGGAPHGEIYVVDPNAPPPEGAVHVRSLAELPPLEGPTVLLAVKPQVIGALLPALPALMRGDALVVSIIAGLSLETLKSALGERAALVRAMPNTPAAVLAGISGAVAGPGVGAPHRARVEALLGAVGEVVWLQDEILIEAVTAVSGSGPAYFFRFAEALADAGMKLGLPPQVAQRLARRTLEGAGALAASTERPLSELRAEVTSPAGTTAAGLARLDAEARLQGLLEETTRAAFDRAVELGRAITPTAGDAVREGAGIEVAKTACPGPTRSRP
jgi:pyrroline-5-carboxylate reductase